MSGVRPARIQDAVAIAGIEVETWRSTYAGILDAQVLLGLSVARQTVSWQREILRASGSVWVWQQNEEVMAYAQCGPSRDQDLPFGGEIYVIYVSPDAQGRGIGRQLLLAQFGVLVNAGYRSALAWVVSGNPSRFFYERLGGRRVATRMIFVGDSQVEVVGYGWTDIAEVLDQWVRSGGRADDR